MKSFFFPCHMCWSYDAEMVTPAFLQKGEHCAFQTIVICKSCGLVYKNPVIPAKNTTVYKKSSWKSGLLFQKRIHDLSVYLANTLEGVDPKFILEIGPGPGWLAAAIETQFPNAKLLLAEVSEEVAKLAKDNTQRATVVPASIDDISLRNGSFDLALVCGVDYLFINHRGSMEKVYHALAEDGYLYIERNVFVETEAYASFLIHSYQDLFGQNALMTTWFNKEQFKIYIEQWFHVVSEKTFLHETKDNVDCLIHGLLCKKRPTVKHDKYYQGEKSWYQTNKTTLDKLSKAASLTKDKPHTLTDRLIGAVMKKPKKN